MLLLQWQPRQGGRRDTERRNCTMQPSTAQQHGSSRQKQHAMTADLLRGRHSAPGLFGMQLIPKHTSTQPQLPRRQATRELQPPLTWYEATTMLEIWSGRSLRFSLASSESKKWTASSGFLSRAL